MSKTNFLFKFYYIGRQIYYGSQRQPNFLTIEQTILDALKERGYIHEIDDTQFDFASRTDRYVSARGACFGCITKKEPILMEINSALPKEIGIWAYSEVPFEFSSRYSAILRHYIYIVPFSISHFKKTTGINIDLINKACKELEGRHDFANFSKKEGDDKNTVKDMVSVNLSIHNDFLVFQFKSKSFLRQQVRRMVKKILEIGLGDIYYEDFLNLFNSSKESSYQPADPKGLILWDIHYEEEVQFKVDSKSRERMNNYFNERNLEYKFKDQLFRALQQDNISY